MIKSNYITIILLIFILAVIANAFDIPNDAILVPENWTLDTSFNRSVSYELVERSSMMNKIVMLLFNQPKQI